MNNCNTYDMHKLFVTLTIYLVNALFMHSHFFALFMFTLKHILSLNTTFNLFY